MKITTENIQVGFHARQILKGISMESKDKELVGIIGPNGSGKSTLLKCIYRILKPDAGAVYLDGEELHSMSVRSSAKKWPWWHSTIIIILILRSARWFLWGVRLIKDSGTGQCKRLPDRG